MITLCGSNKIYTPTEGCSDCDKLEYQLEELREKETSDYNELTGKINNIQLSLLNYVTRNEVYEIVNASVDSIPNSELEAILK